MKKTITLIIMLLLLSTIVMASPVRLRRKYEGDLIKLTYNPQRNSVFYLVDQRIPKGWEVLGSNKQPVTIYKNRLRFVGMDNRKVNDKKVTYYLKPNSTGRFKLCMESASILKNRDWNGKIYKSIK